jgi:hypothetical protein
VVVVVQEQPEKISSGFANLGRVAMTLGSISELGLV